MTSFDSTTDFPGLAGYEVTDRITVPYEIGIWGKHENTTADYSIIACTENFKLSASEYAGLFYVGDASHGNAFMWRGGKESSYAAILHQTRVQDSAGRHSHRTHIIRFPSEASHIPPAILAAAALKIDSLVEHKDIEPPKGLNWSGPSDEETPSLGNHSADLVMDMEELWKTLTNGFSFFPSEHTRESLERYILLLLDPEKLACFPTSQAPPKEAVAALLAALPLAFAQSVSLLDRLPATRPDNVKLAKAWKGILGGETPDAQFCRGQQVKAADPKIMQDVKNTLDTLLPEKKSHSAPHSETLKGDKETDQQIKIALWGPPSSGKTVFLAQLYLHAGGANSPWEIKHISPEEKSRKYFEDQRDRMNLKNHFPAPTIPGDMDDLLFEITEKRDNSTVKFKIEDHAGAKYEQNDEDIVKMMIGSQGMLLFFDLSLPENVLYTNMMSTFEALLHINSEPGGKLEMPLAVCLTKVDEVIKSRADLEEARSIPDAMAKGKIKDKRVLHLVERFFDKIRFFPVSAVGVRVRKQLVESPVFLDNTLTPRIAPDHEVETINLIEPVVWILNTVKKG